MKSLRALKAAGLILAAVVLGLMTVQGSYALWNAAVPSNAGTIQSANFSILIDKHEMNSTPIPFEIGELGRGKASYKALEITNNVNVAPASRMLVRPSLNNLGPMVGFDGYLTVKAAAAPATTECNKLDPLKYSSAPTFSPLAVGSTQKICLQVYLSEKTPVTYLDKTINSAVALTVAQVAPGSK